MSGVEEDMSGAMTLAESSTTRPDVGMDVPQPSGWGSRNDSHDVTGRSGLGVVTVAGNTFNTGGNVHITIDNYKSILHQLKSDLKPIAAAYDSATSSANRRVACFKGTRVKLLGEIGDWIRGQGPVHAPIYVLDGVAGIGKSTIAQTIAAQAAEDGILGASFFFKKDEEDKSNGMHLFSTVAYQLACHNDSIADRILDAVKKRPDIVQKDIHIQFTSLILHPLRNLPSMRSPTLVVIDALDECDANDAKSILALLDRHIASTPHLKLFITFRPESYIQNDLDRHSFHERFHLHDIDSTIVESDIKLYLDFHLSSDQVSGAFLDIKLPSTWQPTSDQKEKLYGICGTLFIIASTAIKFILDDKHSNPAKQCRRLLKGVSTDYSGAKHTDVLDITYMQILLAALPVDDGSESDDSDDDQPREASWSECYQIVLGAIITLQNPLPCRSLAKLLGVAEGTILRTLRNLHSLVAPSSDECIFRVHHKSFPDFITSELRIQKALKGVGRSDDRMTSKLYLDVDAHNRDMTRRCFEVMRTNLKQNMCNLSTVDCYRDRGEIEDIFKKSPIMGHISYACLHWAYHLCAPSNGLDPQITERFCYWASNNVLSWLETLSIIGHIDASHDILENASSIVPYGEPLMVCLSFKATDPERPQSQISANQTKRGDASHNLETVLHDCARLVRMNEALFRLSPMHIYRSGIMYTPVETSLYKLYKSEADVQLICGGERKWNSTWAVLSGHSGEVASIAVSPGGSRLASGSEDKTVQLWDAKLGSHLSSLEGHDGAVRCIAFSPDDLQLASGSDDKTVRLWDAQSGSHLSTLEGHSRGVTYIAFSPDGLRLASGSDDKTVRLWDAKLGSHLSTLEGHSQEVKCIAFSPDGSRLASGSDDKTVRLWDVRSKSHLSTLNGHSEGVTCIAFSPDGSRLASGSDDWAVQLWDAKLGSHLSTLEGHSEPVRCIAFSPDGSQLASGSDDTTVRLWDVRSKSHLSTLNGHSEEVTCVAFSSNGSRLASGSDDWTVRLWDTKLGSHLSTHGGHSEPVRCIAFSPDGSQLASGSDDTTVRVWDVQSESHLSTLDGEGASVRCIAFSPDDSRLASGSNDNTVRLWDAKLGSHLTTLKDHSNWVISIAFSPDGSRLASGSHDMTVRLWDAKSGSHLSTLAGHSDWVTCIAFSPDGSKLASGSDDKTVRLWDAKLGSNFSTLPAHSGPVRCIAFSPDGSQLASGSLDGTARLWDAKSGSHLSRVSTLEGHSASVVWIAFSPDGSQLASGSDDDTVRLWDAQSGAYLSTMSYPYQSHQFAFLPPASAPTTLYSITTGSHMLPLRFLLLIRRREPPNFYGVVVTPDIHATTQFPISPICWFPVDLEPLSFAVNPNGTSVAVGCRNGRVLIIDISSITLP